VEDLEAFSARLVIAKGKVIARDGQFVAPLPSYPYPAWAMRSVHLARKLTGNDFKLRVTGNEKRVTCNVIGVIENQAPTRHLHFELPVAGGEIIIPDTSHLTPDTPDVAKIALVERHRATGEVVVGLVSGFGFTEKCAVATTVAHDSHHMIVVGTDEASMAIAANRLAGTGGGQVVAKDGKIIGEVQLPIAGLMSDERAEVVAKKTATVLDGFKACGCTLNSPNMQLALLALVVIPELRISDKGLVDVTRFEFIPVVES
jgi:adenine deaminase